MAARPTVADVDGFGKELKSDQIKSIVRTQDCELVANS